MRCGEGLPVCPDHRIIGTTASWPGIVLVAMLFTGESPALDITLGADANLVEEYNTNLFLTTAPHNDEWGQGVDGGLDLSVADERWGTSANARFNNRWYLPDSNLDYFNQLFSWKTYYLMDRSRLGLDTQYNMDTTLTSQTDQTDPTANLGFVFTRVPRTVRVVSPNWLYNLTEKTQLNLGYIYQDTTYDEKKNVARFPDSEANTGYLGLSHQLTERLQLTGSASYTDYALTSVKTPVQGLVQVELFPGFNVSVPGTFNIPSVTSSIRTASVMGGINYFFTDTFDITLSAGGQHNETSSPPYTITTEENLFGVTRPGNPIAIPGTSSSTLSEIISARATKRFENGALGLEYDRTISPNIQGALITYDNYSINGSYRFSSQLSTSLNFTYSDRTFPTAQGQIITNSNQLYGARPAINWQWDENWVLSGSYQFYYLSYTDIEATATSHAVFLNIQYLFDKQKL